LLFTVTTSVNYKQWEEVRENADFLAVSSGVVRQSNQLQRNILNMERDLKGYLSGRENYLLEAFDSRALENKLILDDYLTQSPPNTINAEKFDKILTLYNKWVNTFTRPLDRASTGIAIKKLSDEELNDIKKKKAS
jgi:CHASE3 domain sensor protein